MSSHVQGVTEQVAFANFPEGQELNNVNVNSMFFNDGPILPSIFIVSQSARTIYETTHSGTLSKRYRITEEENFELLTQVVMDPSTRILYAASGNTIFALKMDN
jgi:hypothetical protein